jgi:hypothetical protein
VKADCIPQGVNLNMEKGSSIHAINENVYRFYSLIEEQPYCDAAMFKANGR